MKTLGAAFVLLTAIALVMVSLNTDWLRSGYDRLIQAQGVSEKAADQGWLRTKGEMANAESPGIASIQVTPKLVTWPSGQSTQPKIICRSGNMLVSIGTLSSDNSAEAREATVESNSTAILQVPLPAMGLDHTVEIAAGWETFIEDAQGKLKPMPPLPRAFLKFSQENRIEGSGKTIIEPLGVDKWLVRSADPEAPFQLEVAVNYH